MKIGIVGAGGKMGRLLTKYFLSKGHQVYLYNRNIKAIDEWRGKNRIQIVSDLNQLGQSEVIMIAIPIRYTAEIILKLSKIVKKGTIIAEISSIKSPVIEVLKKLKKTGIVPISLHPLFGPNIQELSKERIAIVKVLDLKKEEGLTRKIFPEAKLFTTNLHEHDKMMAYSLVLPYIISLSFGLTTLTEIDQNKLQKFAGPTCNMQIDILKKLMKGGTELLSLIVELNPYTNEIIESLKNNIHEIEHSLKEEDRSIAKICLDLNKELFEEKK